MNRASYGKRTVPRQHGAVLLVALVMLTLMMLLTLSAFNSGGLNLKVVSNMQSRQEAIAAANQALQQTIGASLFTQTRNYANTVNVDIDNDGNNDYTVQIQASCLSFSAYPPKGQYLDVADACNSSVKLGSALCQTVLWDISATATPSTSSAFNAGASATVHQGVTTRLDTNQANNSCS